MKNFLLTICSILLFVQCTAEREDPFLVNKDKVGKLERTHLLSDIDLVYQADSVVRDSTRMTMGNNGNIEVFEKGGKHLLTLTPANDSLPRIENIRIRDPRFMTPKGIGLESTFGDIENAYEIRKVVGSSKNILVLLKDHPVYFTISREELPAALRYSSAAVEAVQIPDQARVKYMMVGWD
jgi:hypothetical protein